MQVPFTFAKNPVTVHPKLPKFQTELIESITKRDGFEFFTSVPYLRKTNWGKKEIVLTWYENNEMWWAHADSTKIIHEIQKAGS